MSLKYYEMLRENIFREDMLGKQRRPDGRAFDQVRSIWVETGLLPRTHGSAVFTRGETQALVTTTLGTGDTYVVTPTSGTIGGQANLSFADKRCTLSLRSDAHNNDWIVRCLCCRDP